MVQLCVYLVRYLATRKHRMQAMPSPTSGMLCGDLVAIVPVLRQDCIACQLCPVRHVGISLAWSGHAMSLPPLASPYIRPHTARRTSMT